MKRTTQGFSLDDFVLAKAIGYDRWLERQLAPEAIDATDVEWQLRRFPTLDATTRELFVALLKRLLTPRRIYQELVESALLPSIISERQLYERMVEFWTNHFSVDQSEPAMQFLTTRWDCDVIRKHAMGRFFDLLRATSTAGAMVFYLDSHTNVAGAPQENYARELLELHCLGAGNGYTQRDVQETARVFTGWSLRPYWRSDAGTYCFRPDAHDANHKRILGLRLDADGVGTTESDRLLAHLAAHPLTARHVARKLATWFLSERPAAWVVDEAARRFLATGGDIREVLRVVLGRRAIGTATPKMRQPRGFLTSILRATRAEVTTGDPNVSLIDDLEALGQNVYRWPTPDGFPDTIAAWGKSLLPRWSFASDFFDERVPSARTDPPRLLSEIGAGPGRQAWGINLLLTGGTITRREQAIVQNYIDEHQATPDAIREAFALAASSPSVQLY